MKTAFVTGGTGAVGRVFVPYLAGAGWKVVALTRNPEKADLWRSTSVQYVAGDLSTDATREWMKQVDAKYDAVFHLAASLAYVDTRERLFATNVAGTEATAEFAVRVGAKRFVYASSIEAGGAFAATEIPAPLALQHEPLTHYGESKIAAEQVALRLGERGVSAICVRLGNVYGPGWSNLVVECANALLTRDRLWEYLPVVGDRYLSPVHTDDVSAGLLAAERTDYHGIVNLVGQAATMEEIFHFCADAMDRPFSCGRPKLADRMYVYCSTRYLRRLWGHFDTLSYLSLPKRPRIHRAVSMRESNVHLKWSPAVPLRTGVAETVRWARSAGLLAY